MLNAELLRQSVGGLPVNQAEIDGLGSPPGIAVHGFWGKIEDLGGSGRVNILPLSKSLQQTGIPGKVGHDPQLDLGVIGAEQAKPGFSHKSLTNAPSLFGSYGNILQIGGAGRQPPSGRHRLLIVGMDSPGLRIDHFRQGIRIGIFQLGHAPVFENQTRELRLHGQLGQYLFTGGRLSARRFFQDRQLHFIKKNLLDLFR